MILLVNSHKGIYEPKNGFDISRITNSTDLLSIKVVNALRSVEKTMIQKQLPKYVLSNVHLSSYNSHFKFILMLTEDTNLNSGPAITIHNKNMWHKLLFRKCNLSIDGTEFQ